MTKEEIQAGVQDVFVGTFGEDAWEKFREHPKPFVSLVEAGGDPDATEFLDSLDQMEFVLALEDRFNIRIDDVSAQLIRNVEAAVNAVQTRTGKPLHGDQ